jgi:hypothetical protein
MANRKKRAVYVIKKMMSGFSLVSCGLSNKQ